MLGRLARWLRILGVDAEYAGDMGDEELISKLSRGDLLFTRDRALAARAARRGVKTVYLPQDFLEALRIAIDVLGIEARVDMDKTRCPLCGGRLRRVEKSFVKGRVPEKVFDAYDEFYVCERCGHIYWVGTHMKEIEAVLEKVRVMTREKREAYPRGGTLPSKAGEEGG